MRAKPRIFASKCLGFANCRWDGATVNDRFVERLGKHVDYVAFCPEMEIGLGCPRDPIRVVLINGQRTLFQPNTGKEFSKEMLTYRSKQLSALKKEKLSGFILKSRSPSCGIKDVKLFTGTKETSGHTGGSAGFFGEGVLQEYAPLAIEDEGRLTNFPIRENFLAKIFTHAEFLAVKNAGTARALSDFQAKNKYLLLAYNEKEMRLMGSLAANLKKRPVKEVNEEYGGHLLLAFAKQLSFKPVINVLTHALGYFKEQLVKEEKKFFLESMEKYRAGKLPLSAVTGLLQMWIVKYKVDYLKEQTFFSPFPEELVDLGDSGKGR